MNDIRLFEGKEVEILEWNGQVLFNPKHVAEILGIKNVNDNLRSFSEKQIVKLTNSKIGKADFRKLHNTGENFLTESGVYRLAFKSHKPQAERFTSWVTDEVLPSIRKNGGYVINQENLTPEQIVANALIVAQNIIKEKDRQIEEMKPKADYHDQVLNKDKLISTTIIAKDLGMSAVKLNQMLNRNGVLFKSRQGVWMPYGNYNWLITEGYADYQSFIAVNSLPVLKWTEKGRKWIIKNIGKWN